MIKNGSCIAKKPTVETIVHETGTGLGCGLADGEGRLFERPKLHVWALLINFLLFSMIRQNQLLQDGMLQATFLLSRN